MLVGEIIDTSLLGHSRIQIASCFTEGTPFEIHAVITKLENGEQDYIVKKQVEAGHRANIKGWLSSEIFFKRYTLESFSSKDLEYFMDNESDYMFVPVNAVARRNAPNKELKNSLKSLNNL